MIIRLAAPPRALRPPPAFAAGLAAAAALCLIAPGAPRAQAPEPRCESDAGLALPPGFCATVFADNIGHARQMAVSDEGVVYVNTWSGVYYKSDALPPGGFLVALKDTKGAGRADVIARFGETVASGGHGGTGVALYNGALYAESNDEIVRYSLSPNEIAPKSRPTTVVSGLPVLGDHPMHPLAIDAKGNLFVDLGSATNSCEEKNRMPGSPGREPCRELETRGGIWRYDANRSDQRFSPAERYATGLRNAEGFAFDAAGRFFATQHGRDQLAENWPAFYTREQGQNLPAEEVVEVVEGGDYGWPQCYFDGEQQKLALAPEYGGNGGKRTGVCKEKRGPVAFFPAHWAPNDMKIYQGAAFPEAYSGGAFIAFHGSWNRAPGPQGGYNVVFQPLKDGKAAGPFVVFADGFAGAVKEPGRAAFRPSGLAVGPDGALYVSDDQHGRIWRIVYAGDPKAGVEAAVPASQSAAAAADAVPPEGVHPDAGDLSALRPPPGATEDQVALGARLFRGELRGAACAGCHGADARGTPVGADLTAAKRLWSDGSPEGIAATITAGVPEPKQHPGAMPPLGGAQLLPGDVEALAAYIWALAHKN